MLRIDDAGRVALAVCLLFDARTDVLMRELWSRLEDVGVATLATHTHRRHHPHLSYAVLRSWELARVQETLTALPAAEPFTMSFHGTLAFPRGRAALACRPLKRRAGVDAVSEVWPVGGDQP